MTQDVTRRNFLRAAGGSLLLLTARRSPAETAERRETPNIILCMTDDQGWGDVGYNGHPVLKTPILDEMAGAGLRFDRFYAAAPVCSPTRGSVLTGRNPTRFGCFHAGHVLRPQETTIAQTLKGRGYVCGHFGKWHVGTVYKNSPVNPAAFGFDEWASAPNFFDFDPILSRQGVAEQFRGDSSAVTVDLAVDFIRRQNKSGKPFLALVWFGSPHDPHQSTEENRRSYAGEDKPHQNYYGEIAGVDQAMGRLRKELRDLGIHKNTLVWFCSDNGGVRAVSRTGGRAGKGTLYEGGLRVPAILEWPDRIAAGSTTRVPCCTSDIYPTLVEITGEAPAGSRPLDGISLLPLIRGGMQSRPRPIGFWHYPAAVISTPSLELMKRLFAAQREGREVTGAALCPEAGKIGRRYPEREAPGPTAWLDRPWKLHVSREKGAAPKIELYNLEQDPREERDLSEAEAPRVSAMHAQLDVWTASVVRSLNGRDYE